MEVRFDNPVRWVGGPQHNLHCPYDRVWVLESTVEQRPEPKSSRRRAASGARSVGATGSLRGPLATLVAKHRDPTRYTVTQIIDALVEAERLGVGSKLAQYFRAKLRAEDVERAYGRARGIVSFERDGRPPSPPDGQSYGSEDFGELLMGLAQDPVVAERLAEGRAWADRMNAVTGDRVLPWLPRGVQDVIRFVQDYRARVEPWVARGEEPAPTEAAVESAECSSQESCEVQDSSFDDPQQPPLGSPSTSTLPPL